MLFDEAASQLLTLNESGAAFWHLLDGERSLEDVAHFIQTELGDGAPPQPELERDLDAFARELLERGALELAPPS